MSGRGLSPLAAQGGEAELLRCCFGSSSTILEVGPPNADHRNFQPGDTFSTTHHPLGGRECCIESPMEGLYSADVSESTAAEEPMYRSPQRQTAPAAVVHPLTSTDTISYYSHSTIPYFSNDSIAEISRGALAALSPS
jgi:hypothetical protein